MSKSRRPPTFACDDPTAYPVFADASVSEQVPELNDALLRLAEALTSVPDPLRPALRDLDQADIKAVLNAMPVKLRKHALSPLGIPLGADRVNTPLCRDVRARLQQNPGSFRTRHALRHLTEPVLGEFLDVAHRGEVERRATVREPHWSRPLLRLCLWTQCGAAVADIPLWQWGLGHDWMTAGMEQSKVNEVQDALAVVVELLPESPVTGDVPEQPVNERDAQVPGPASADSARIPSAGQGVVPALRRALHELQAAVIDAGQPAGRIAAAVADEARPQDKDLAAVRNLAETFDSVLASFRALGLEAPEARVESVTTAVARVAEQVGADEIRGGLGAVTRLRAPAGSAAAELLDQAQREAWALLADEFWDETERRRAEAMTALVCLVRLHGREVDSQELFDLQKRWATGMPELAALAFHIPQLAEDGPSADADPSPEAPHPAGDREDDTGTPAAAGKPEPAQEPEQAPATPRQADSSEPEQPDPAPAVAEGMGIPVQRIPDPHPVPENRLEAAAAAAAAADAEAVALAVAGSDADTEDPALAAVAELVATQRFGLAHHIAAAAGWDDQRQTALRIAAYAHDLRTEAGGCAAALSRELPALDAESVAVDWPSAALSVAALLRTALVAGEHTAGALLHALSSRLEENLAAIADEVAHRALSGALLQCPPLTVVEDVAAMERDLAGAREACREALRRPTGFRFPRASQIAKRWLAEDGMLGSVLHRAAADDRDALPEIVEAIHRIATPDTLRASLDELDRQFMSPGGKPLQGRARQELLRLALTRVQPAEQWVVAARVLPRSRSQGNVRSRDEVAAMRSAVLKRKDAALEALSRRADHELDPLGRAAALSARASLSTTFSLLAGDEGMAGEERPVGLVRDAELLRLPDVRVVPDTHDIRLSGAALDDLVGAVRRSWTEAIRQQAAGEHFDTIAYLLDCADRGLLAPGQNAGTIIPDDIRREAREARQRSTVQLAALHERLDAELRQARINDAVSQEQEGTLDRRLQAAVPERADLGAVRDELTAVRNELAQRREQREDDLRARLDTVREPVSGARERVTEALNSGQYSTAEEMILQLETDGTIPEIDDRPRWFEEFFPRLPEALEDGLTTELVQAVRSRVRYRELPELDYGELSEEHAVIAAEALEHWSAMGRRTRSQRQQGFRESELLMPALRLIGYSSLRSPQRRDDLRKLPDYRFVDLPEVRLTGGALVPAFGSDLGPRLRIMLVWGQPAPELLLSYADTDPGSGSLLVAYFGTMSPKDRTALAVHCVGRRPILVLDDAALAYLAAHGNRRLNTAMSVMVPFSAVNPYIAQKRGQVAEEMFFGRKGELEDLLDPKGKQVVFGGRGLGKSALLREVSRAFEEADDGNRISLVLSLDTVHFGGAATAETVWTEIGRKLAERGIRPKKPTKSPAKITHSYVSDVVRTWLAENDSRGLMVLLDEADKFFECDSPGFLETRRLRGLGQDSDGRVKVVFAGLHSVQRYAKVARNSPFSHLAQNPTVVGPLKPQDAANLLARPLSALGYEFEDPDLVHRILGYCSYQPFLLQMFGHRLVETMHKRRGEPGAGRPPYTVTRADVQAVHADTGLRQGITSAFRDTLLLDPRYNVIANVLARHAHEHGIQSHLGQPELRQECLAWWASGFRGMDAEAFRAYLSEMEGLGVLAPDTGHGWHLRSTNALSMIGTLDEVENQLINTESEGVPEEFAALESRPWVNAAAEYAPMTTSQVSDVLGGHNNQVRVVIGSEATGVCRAATALRSLTSRAGGWTVPPVRGRGEFARELVSGKAGDKRVVLCDLTVKAPHDTSCLEALSTALEEVPTAAGVTRSAVIVAGPGQRSLWHEVLLSRTEAPALQVVVLRRYTRQGLRIWALDQQRFTSEEYFGRLADATGGWPLLVDKVGDSLREGLTEKKALTRLREYLEDPERCTEFIGAVGLGDGGDLPVAYALALEWAEGEGLDTGDLVDVAEDALGTEGAPEAIESLVALQVFDASEHGRHTLEPVLAACWRRLRGV